MNPARSAHSCSWNLPQACPLLLSSKTLHKPPHIFMSLLLINSMARTIPIPCSFSVFLVLILLFSSCCVAEILLPLNHRLSHSDAHQSTSTQHLLKSSCVRSSLRHRRQQKVEKQLHEQQHVEVEQVSVPLSAGSDYTLSLSVGPNRSVSLYMDTGSDLVWFPCSPFQCILCEGKSPTTDSNYSTSPPPPPPQSKIVHCSDPTCSAAHSNLPSSDLCTIAGCPLDELETSSCPPSSSHSRCPPFYYAYGDGSLVGTLRRGHVSLSGGLVSLPNFTFACAHSALAEPVGVAGFGRGLLSLPTQLSPASLGSRFSYCLLSHSFRSERLLQPSLLILGRSSSSSSFPFIYTPILSNPKHPYLYTVGLAAISIGAATIKADRNLMSVDGEGNGGLAVDSGTTFTMLPSKLYSKIVSVFAEQMKLAGFVERAKETESETGLSPCYYYSGRNDSRKVPAMKPHFVGGATLELPTRNYFLGFASSSSTSSGGGKKRVGCLMIMDGGDGSDAGGGPAGTLGNFQQQGFEVVYDLEMDKVGFARRRCSLLWDQLTSRGRGG